jgi:hypothetical protein
MKIYYLFILLFGALLISTAATSQNIRTSSVEWNCSLTSISMSGSVTGENTKVVSSSNNIVWYNEDGSVRKTLSIVNAAGSWGDVSDDGIITFSVTSDGNTGTVSFSKTHDIVQISIQVADGPDSPIYDLTVSTVNAL